jgi:hypothetical protein
MFFCEFAGVDVLSILIDRAKEAGLIKGMINSRWTRNASIC